MKSSFATQLGDILFTDTMSNSYYDDEADHDCETPDYDEAYRLILDTKSITMTDLKESYFDPEENEKFTGLDLIKLAIAGDFDNEFDYHSNMKLNLESLGSLVNSLPKSPKIWDKRSKTEEEAGRSNVEYKKCLVTSTSLATIAYNRIARCARQLDKDQLITCRNIAKKLSSYKTFAPQERNSRYYTSLETSYKEKASDTDKENLIKLIKRFAGLAKNNQIDKLLCHPETNPYTIKECAVDLLVFGQSQDKFFNKIASEVKDLKEVMKERIKIEAKETSVDQLI